MTIRHILDRPLTVEWTWADEWDGARRRFNMGKGAKVDVVARDYTINLHKRLHGM
jgi:hypothetical protein